MAIAPWPFYIKCLKTMCILYIYLHHSGLYNTGKGTNLKSGVLE